MDTTSLGRKQLVERHLDEAHTCSEGTFFCPKLCEILFDRVNINLSEAGQVDEVELRFDDGP